MAEKNTPPKYKHQSDIDKYATTDCPPRVAQSKRGDVFRWVNSPISEGDFKNYIKLGLLPPVRAIGKKNPQDCKRCGLSMFESLDAAKDRYNAVVGIPVKKNIPSYTHVAKGALVESDGVGTEADENGHFTFHEYENTDIKNKFTIVSTIA